MGVPGLRQPTPAAALVSAPAMPQMRNAPLAVGVLLFGKWGSSPNLAGPIKRKGVDLVEPGRRSNLQEPQDSFLSP